MVSTSVTANPGPAKVGEKLPDFTSRVATQTEIKEFHLSQELGQGPVVIAFFPLAFTGVCTKEMCEMRDAVADLNHLKVKAFGFSTDTPFTNREFAKLHKLEHGIISDPNHEVVNKIWSTQTVGGVHNRAKRGVLVLDAQGVVKWSWVTDDPAQWVGLSEVRKHL
ncbi:MAG: redoxin domain-containing protein [Thermoplasmatota archaeon]